MNPLLRKHRKAENDLSAARFLRCYSELLEGLTEVRKALIVGYSTTEVLELVNEILVTDDALWSLYEGDMKHLHNKHTKERKKYRQKHGS